MQVKSRQAGSRAHVSNSWAVHLELYLLQWWVGSAQLSPAQSERNWGHRQDWKEESLCGDSGTIPRDEMWDPLDKFREFCTIRIETNLKGYLVLLISRRLGFLAGKWESPFLYLIGRCAVCSCVGCSLYNSRAVNRFTGDNPQLYFM